MRNEREDEIGRLSAGLVASGEEAVNEVRQARRALLKDALTARLNGNVDLGRQLDSDIGDLNKIINTSQTMLQVRGEDSLSELSRKSEEMGLGSITDPESSIRKALAKRLSFWR